MKTALISLALCSLLIACGRTSSEHKFTPSQPDNGAQEQPPSTPNPNEPSHPTPTPSPSPNPSPTPVPNPSPSPTPVPAPSPTPAPNPTPSPTPSPSPSPNPPPDAGSPTLPPIPTPDPQDEPGRGYFLATPSQQAINRKLRTRLLVAGADSGARTLWQEAARGRAARWSRLFPNDQVVLILPNELGIQKSKKLLQAWGLRVISHVDRSLEKNLFTEFQSFQKIASLDLFTEMDEDWLWGFDLGDDLANEAWRFTSDSHVFLHGSNAGWMVAPRLSELWTVPVLGALSPVDFERLTIAGAFRRVSTHEKDLRWATVNDVSFKASVSCAEGVCARVKPVQDFTPGLKFGLSVYKAFCSRNFTVDCQKRIATAYTADLTAWKDDARPSKSAFTLALKDAFCADTSPRDQANQCQRSVDTAIKNNDSSWDPFKPQARCTFMGCSRDDNSGAKTSFRELQALLNGL